jgi:RNA polymerase sigma-70 factor (ECF subfamily)
MLASYDEADDAVQETFLRAWRSRARFEGGDLVRAWLYKIATNVCLDLLKRRGRRVAELHSVAEVPWLQPYPDRLLDEIAPSDDEPDAVVVERETIELAFLAALQVLPPRQRAALLARDVLGMPAADTAALLDTSVAAANSALQRARATLQRHLPDRHEGGREAWPVTEPSAQERELLDRFIDAHERCDAEAALAAAAPDLRITMPPHPHVFEGLDVILPSLRTAFGVERDGDWRLLPTTANRLPAAASYLRRDGDTTFRAFKLDVLRVRDGKIAEITTFGYSLFPAFGLPPTI